MPPNKLYALFDILTLTNKLFFSGLKIVGWGLRLITRRSLVRIQSLIHRKTINDNWWLFYVLTCKPEVKFMNSLSKHAPQFEHGQVHRHEDDPNTNTHHQNDHRLHKRTQ